MSTAYRLYAKFKYCILISISYLILIYSTSSRDAPSTDSITAQIEIKMRLLMPSLNMSAQQFFLLQYVSIFYMFTPTLLHQVEVRSKKKRTNFISSTGIIPISKQQKNVHRKNCVIILHKLSSLVSDRTFLQAASAQCILCLFYSIIHKNILKLKFT